MHCYQARRRLNESEAAITDRELLDHLRNCPDCARIAEAAQLLERAFVVAGDEDKLDLPSLAVLKARVESKRRLDGQERTREITIMSALKRQLKERRRLGFAIGFAAVALALITLIPFTFEKTVGYEVAIAGVDENLALNDERINEFLTQLGIEDVTIDVSDCNKVCNMRIGSLKSPHDAQLVQAAFSKFDNVHVSSEIGEKRENVHCSVAMFIADEAMIELHGDMTDDEVQRHIQEKLGENFTFHYCIQDAGEDANIVITGMHADSVTMKNIFIGRHADSIHASGHATACFSMDSMSMDSCMKWCTIGIGSDGSQIGGHGEHQMVFSGDINEILREVGIDPDNMPDEIDEETRNKLAEKGIVLDMINAGDGMKSIMLSMGGDCKPQGTSDGSLAWTEADDPAAKQGNEILPEGYSLSQNYPNPFNPETTIEYSVGNYGNVTIDIINVMGQTVRRLVDKEVSPGEYSVVWDATNDSGDRVASGVYYYRITAGDFRETKSMTLLK